MQLSEPVMTLLTHVCHLLPVISQGSPPCLGYVNVLQSCKAVDCLVAAWSLAKELKVLAATKQLWMILSIFSSHTPLIRSNWHWQRQRPCKMSRSEVKVTEIKTNFAPIWVRTVTPVWIHIWLTNDVQSLKQPRKCALLFFKVICEISRSHRQIWEIW